MRRPPSIFDNYDDQLVDLPTAAQYLHLSPPALQALVANRRILHYLIHGAPCFAVADLFCWRQRHPITCRSSPPPSVFTEPADRTPQPAQSRTSSTRPDHGFQVIDLPVPTPPRAASRNGHDGLVIPAA